MLNLLENNLERGDDSGEMLQKVADRMLFSANHLCRSVQPACTHLQTAGQQTQSPPFDNSPSSHSALLDQETPVITPVISPALWWAGKGGVREAVGV